MSRIRGDEEKTAKGHVWVKKGQLYLAGSSISRRKLEVIVPLNIEIIIALIKPENRY